MIQRAEWRQLSGPAWTPMGIHFGKERWQGLPVGLWVVLYAIPVFSLTSHLPRPFHMVALFMLFPLLMNEWFEPERKRKPLDLPPPTSLRERLSRSLVEAGPDSALLLLEPQPSPTPNYHVKLSLRRGWRTSGEDRGVVAFSDGWLVYEGEATSFALASSDVLASEPKDGWTLRLPDDQSVVLTNLSGAEWEIAIVDWLRSTPPTGLSRLPPLLPSHHQRFLLAARLHLGACMILGSVLAKMMGAMNTPMNAFPTPTVALATIFLIAGCVAWRWAVKTSVAA